MHFTKDVDILIFNFFYIERYAEMWQSFFDISPSYIHV